MKHGAVSDELKEAAALYALGALSQHEARHFEYHLSEGCDICQGELDSFAATVATLAFGVEEEPPPRVRQQLLAACDEERSKEARIGRLQPALTDTSLSQFISIRASDSEWDEIQKGVLMKTLFVDKGTGLATSLVKMLPGTSLPAHKHNGVEQLFILEGDCNVRGERLGPGDYHRADAGSIHETTYTVDGTLFLLVAPETCEIIEAQ